MRHPQNPRSMLPFPLKAWAQLRSRRRLWRHPNNDLNLVAEILQKLHFNGNESVSSVKTGTTTLHRRARSRTPDHAAESQNCSGICNARQLRTASGLAKPENQAALDAYVYDRGLIDLLTEYPGVIDDPNEMVALLPSLHRGSIPSRPVPRRTLDNPHHGRGCAIHGPQSRSRRRMLHILR